MMWDFYLRLTYYETYDLVNLPDALVYDWDAYVAYIYIYIYIVTFSLKGRQNFKKKLRRH
jgi:hypothetical protein